MLDIETSKTEILLSFKVFQSILIKYLCGGNNLIHKAFFKKLDQRQSFQGTFLDGFRYDILL